MKRFSFWILLSTCFVLLNVGCGGGTKDPPRYQASGTVTWDGNPVDGATVTFMAEGTGYAATATTDASGKFELKAIEGTQVVTVQKLEVVEVPFDMEGAAGPDGQTYTQSETKWLTPGIYSTPQGNLKADVTADGPNTFEFTLTGQAGEPSQGSGAGGGMTPMSPGMGTGPTP